MKTKNIYDHNRKHIGTVKYLKNKNMYSVTFHDDTHYANTLVSVDGLDDYLGAFGFIRESELGQLNLTDFI